MALPAIIGLIVGATALVTWIDPLKVLAKLPGDPGKLVISGTKLTMQSPKLTGYTRDHRWYELTANAAAQDITKPDLVELHEVRAKLEAEDKSTLFLSAADGLFDRKVNVLTLNKNIKLKSSSGYEVHLAEAIVDTTSGAIVSNKPVEVVTDRATVTSERLEVINSGEVVRFLGNVVMNLPATEMSGAPAAVPK